MNDSIQEHLTSPERIAAERVVLARRVQRMTGELTTSATQKMEETLPWYIALPANERASVGTVAQAGVATFVEWFSNEQTDSQHISEIFTAAPRELARALTLQQTVELVRTTMDVVEGSIAKVAGDNRLRQALLRESLLRFSSEMAFAAAEVFARAAEARGAWDARLQDLVLDAVLSNDDSSTLLSRASAAGWDTSKNVFVLVGPIPSRRTSVDVHMEQIRRSAKSHNLDVIVGMHDDRMVVLISGDDFTTSPTLLAKPLLPHFGRGTVVCGPVVSSLVEANTSAVAATSGFESLGLVSTQERIITSNQLIASRVLSGDTSAIAALVEVLRTQLRDDVKTTLATYLEKSPTIEGCAKAMFVHVNTVRYRLRKVSEVTHLDPMDPADSFTLRLALMFERNTSFL